MKDSPGLTQQEVDLYHFYRKNGIKNAFFLRYFQKLPGSRTTAEAFEATNDEYYALFGDYRYSAVHSFRKCLKDYLTK